MADSNRDQSADFDDDVDVEAPSARAVKFHTLRNAIAVGVCGALFEARRAMFAAPGGRLGRCVLAGLNTMTVGAIFFGSQAVMGHLRLEDDAFNSFGAGLVTGSILSGSLMSQITKRTVPRWGIMALWGLIGTVGHHAAVFAGADQLPDFSENDPIRAMLRRLAAPPPPAPTPSSGDPGLYLPPQRSAERDETISKTYRSNDRPPTL